MLKGIWGSISGVTNRMGPIVKIALTGVAAFAAYKIVRKAI